MSTYCRGIRSQRLPNRLGCTMGPSKKIVSLYVVVFLDIWEKDSLGWQRRCIVTDCYVSIAGDRSIDRNLVRVMPVAPRHVIALKNVNIESSISNFAIGN